MKKSVLFLAMALMSAGMYAQADAIKEIKKLTSSRDYAAAEAKAQEAIQTPENQTVQLYMTAAQIGYKQLMAESDKIYENPLYKIDYMAIGPAIVSSCEYLIEADRIALTPTLDKKGNEVTDQKSHKAIQKMLLKYYTQLELVKYGSDANTNDDYEAAYKAFEMHARIPRLEGMQDEKTAAQMPLDTTYREYQYYAALFAQKTERYAKAAELFEDNGKAENSHNADYCYQLAYECHRMLGDTTNMVRVLQDGSKRVGSPFYLQNLINIYISSGKVEQAIAYLDEANRLEPNAEYLAVKGSIEENMGKTEEAVKAYEEAINMNPKCASAYEGLGRIYYNQAVKINETAVYLTGKAYQAEEKKMNALYKQAMPYFEKAVENDPENKDYLVNLRGLYYRFGMQAKYNEIQARIKEIENK